MPDHNKENIKAIFLVIAMLLFTLLLLHSCDGTWTIAGWEVK
tara:strand:+ start:454 stop:579 length:126 start_codon:yes stop_codon:yes gene_type:complete